MRSKLNLFEGARRIALLAGVMWGIGVFVAFYNGDLRVEMRFDVVAPNITPVRVPGISSYTGCPGDDKWAFISGVTGKNTKVGVTFCFKLRDFPKGRLVPYKVDSNGGVWGDETYSKEVSLYVDGVTQRFRLSKADEEWADSQYWPAVRNEFGKACLWLFGGWVALWILTALVGWIIRGFAGIPMGKDHRPEETMSN
jgi:hypothetical protein